MSTKIVITGGAGFIGYHLVEYYCNVGYRVIVIDDFSGMKVYPETRLHPLATYEKRDLGDLRITFDLVVGLMQGAQVVYHLAARPRVQYSIEHPATTHQANVQGTVNVLEAARQAGVKRVVFASSSSVYGESQDLPLKETHEPRPMSPYALQKRMGEMHCKQYSELYKGDGPDTACLRFFNVYGPGADPNGPYALVVAKFIEQRLQGIPLTIAGDGTHTRDYTHVSDVVRAMVLAGTRPEPFGGDVINIGGGRQVSVNEVAARVGGPVVHVEPRQEPAHTLADIARAKRVLGWQPEVSFEQGMAELLALHNLVPAA